MTKALRVVVADDEQDLLDFYRAALASLGHEVVATAENGEQLVDQCLATRPDLVITDIRMPRKDGIEAALEVFRATPTRVILVTGYSAPAHIHRALREMVLAYLAKPFRARDLESAIERAEQRFEEFQALLEGDGDPLQAVRNREVLKVAKGVLVTKAGLSDRAAFLRLQQMAQQKNVKIMEVARTVITGDQAFDRSQEARLRSIQVTNCL